MERRHPRHPPARPLILIADGHEDTRAMYALGSKPCLPEELALGLREILSRHVCQ